MLESANLSEIEATKKAMKWSAIDVEWGLSLFGTAVGAGILFLPIAAGAGGFWPLVILTILTGPMVWLSHLGLSRFVLSADHQDDDITDTFKEHFGHKKANILNLIYFFAIYPNVIVYGDAITNTFMDFIVNQLGMGAPPRWLLSGVLIMLMTSGVLFGKNLMIKVCSMLVYPLAVVLFAVSVYLMKDWNMSMITASPHWASMPLVIWIALPIVVFSFSHAPLISQFTKAQRVSYGVNAQKKADKIIGINIIALMLFTMFFVFSIVLALSPAQLIEMKNQNISVLSYIADLYKTPFIAYLGPLIAVVAISSSYFGHFTGAHEGAVGFIAQNTKLKKNLINKISIIALVLTTWIVAIINPSILGLMGALAAPVLILILYFMPVYAMRCIPALKKYRTSKVARIFIAVCGVIALTSCFHAIYLNLITYMPGLGQ